MNAPTRTLFLAGAETALVEDFRALAEATAPDGAPRYREQPVLQDLARFLVHGGNGPNRDTAFYELCHLVNAVDASENGRDRRNTFFLSPEAASPGRFRARMDKALAKAGWRRGGFTLSDSGIAVQYSDGAFTIRYGRMPFLAALYEFLSGMEDFAFYSELQAVFDEMTATPADVKAVQRASNRIASHFRQYRRRHLAPIRHDGKFDLIYGFLAARSPASRVIVDDAAVLDFWSEKSASGDFRAYRTVFDAFVHFLQAADEAGKADAVARAASIGIDRENGEIEPDDSGTSTAETITWVSPFEVLDQEPAASIKFLKKEGERKPVEVLMHYGPAAIRLPLAFLRLESFGPVQSAITTDLQIGRGLDRVQTRAACTEAVPYREIAANFASVFEIIKRLQKAAFYALHRASEGSAADTNIVPLRGADSKTLFDQARAPLAEGCPLPETAEIERLADEAARVFRSISRKGFDEAGLGDEARIEGFRLGAMALVAAAAQIERYLAAAGGIERGGKDLEGWFDADQRAFSKKFCSLYGVSL